ncbi:hypothetical protein A2U01_0062113 [Trifolium medium]|uniref:Uncharacterized protein n=1 Tax=Trifolium medium TaxID=97028 RepID=A0A392RYM3_9FABA|nr:hypothetical protein [Trifolium medium]
MEEEIILRKELRDARDQQRKSRKAERTVKKQREQLLKETRAAAGFSEVVCVFPEGGLESITWAKMFGGVEDKSVCVCG